MRISYAIPVCNELEEIQKLLYLLQENIRKHDQIVVMIDEERGTDEVENYVEDFLLIHSDHINFRIIYHSLANNFAAHKNFLNSACNGDWIFQIDADEIPDKTLIQHLPEILETNKDIDAIWVPRINIVNGITPEHIAKWRWTQNDDGWINWPNDAQLRLYKNKPEIIWQRKVHEILTGFNSVSRLPDRKEFALWHIKEISRQESQNEFYEKI